MTPPEVDDGEAVLNLPAILDIREATPLAAKILARRGKALTIDASDVRRVGGLCMQVLLSAQRTWSADGQALHISNPTDALREACQLLGATSVAFA